MTKREFDKATKHNFGYARGDLEGYRLERGASPGVDLLVKRAVERRECPSVSLRSLQSAPKRVGGFAVLRPIGIQELFPA